MRARTSFGRWAVVAATAATGLALLPSAASAATESPVRVLWEESWGLDPYVDGGGGFGLYHFNVQQAPGGDPPSAWAAPFTNGAGMKDGHCIELTEAAANAVGTLLSGADLTISSPAQIQWLLQSSYFHRDNDADYANGIVSAAHQSAVWKVTDPGDPANDIGTATAARATADAMADQLVAAAAANAGAVDQSTWGVSIAGGATCIGGERTVNVTGSPFTTATLTITSGTAHFANNAQTIEVALDAAGKGSTTLIDDGTTSDTVAVAASLPSWTLAQADNNGKQDFAYLIPGPNVNAEATAQFIPCLQVSKTVNPSFTRTFDWSMNKVANKTKVTTKNDSTTFTYTVTATKSAPVDSGWQANGTITIANTTGAAVSNATVTDAVSNGGTCTVANGTGVSIPAGGSVTLNYVCTYPASGPTAVQGTNVATITYCEDGSGACSNPVTFSNAPLAFAFGGPTTVVHDSVRVTDTLDGVTTVLAESINSTQTFTYERTIPVPAKDCAAHTNTVVATDVNDTGYTRTDTETVEVCRAGGVGPAGKPERTAISVHKGSNRVTVQGGKNVKFTIRFKVTGKAAAINVRVCDRLPSAMTFVSAPGAKFVKGQACWTRKNVKRGTTLVFRVTAKVDNSVGVGKACNNVVATAGNANAKRARVCVNVRPRAGNVGGGIVGVTG
jgi:uncharacterized repeat protein (TIGR01451 family)